MAHLTRILFLSLLFSLTSRAADIGPGVVVSIEPLHSLVTAVMQGRGQPVLLLKGGISPHDYSLKPSDMRALSEAKVVFWVGPALETFLRKPLENISARRVALMQAPGVAVLPLREGGIWESHEEHEYEEAESDHAAEGLDRVVHEDAHIWLDPHNAIAMVRQIEAVLAELDSGHKDVYQANADRLIQRLQILDEELRAELDPIKHRPFIVFHDAYQYFEHRYGLQAAGSITVNPEQRPGTRRLQEIRRRIADDRVVCVFREPQFRPALVDMLIENTSARTGVLDPIGADLSAGPEAYFQLLKALADELHDCLIENGQNRQ